MIVCQMIISDFSRGKKYFITEFDGESVPHAPQKDRVQSCPTMIA